MGFFTHQVKLAEPVLGATGAGWLVGVTGLAGLLGRLLLLAWIADRIKLRGYAAAIFATQALALVMIVIAPGAPVLVGMTFVYGFCLGQITTLSRRRPRSPRQLSTRARNRRWLGARRTGRDPRRGPFAERQLSVALLAVRKTMCKTTVEGLGYSDNSTFRKEYQRIVEGVRKAGLPES